MQTHILPSGIYYLPTKTGIKYAIRFMLGGARITLPATNTLQEAINAMIDFKIQDLEKQRTMLTATLQDPAEAALQSVSQELTQAEMQAVANFREILSEVDPSSLEFGQPANVSGVFIPAKIVTDYLNALYNGTL